MSSIGGRSRLKIAGRVAAVLEAGQRGKEQVIVVAVLEDVTFMEIR